MKLFDPTKIIDKGLKRDRGDISGLAQNIKENGLLQLPVVNQKGELIIGGRRLEAVKLLKMKEMPCIEVITKGRDDEFRKALAENVQRKDFLPSEMVAVAKQLKPQVAAESRRRKLSGLKRGDKVPRPEKFSEREAEETRQIVAKQLNTSFPTLRKAEEIVDSGDKELIVKMDRDKKVDAVYKILKKKQSNEPVTVEGGRSESEKRRVQLGQHLVQVKKKIEKLNQSLVPLLEYKDVFLSARCQKSKEGQDFVYAMAGLFSTVHILMSKKRKEVDLIESFKLLVQSKKEGEKKL